MTDLACPPAPASVSATPRRRGLPAPLTLLVAANAVSLIGNVVMTVAIPWLTGQAINVCGGVVMW